MACCKVSPKRSGLSLAIERCLNDMRGATCSRLFKYSPRAAGMVYRSFGLCVALAVLGVPALILVVAFAAS